MWFQFLTLVVESDNGVPLMNVGYGENRRKHLMFIKLMDVWLKSNGAKWWHVSCGSWLYRQFVVQFTMQCDDSTQHCLQDMTSFHFILFSFYKYCTIFFSFGFLAIYKRLMLNLFANHFVLNMNQKYNNHSMLN